jgi:hypothetical protein
MRNGRGKGTAMHKIFNRPTRRPGRSARPIRQDSDYVYQAATVVAALLLLLTAAL